MIPYLFFAQKLKLLFLPHSSYKNRHIIPVAVIAVSQHPLQNPPAHLLGSLFMDIHNDFLHGLLLPHGRQRIQDAICHHDQIIPVIQLP